MTKLNTDYLAQCIKTLEYSMERLQSSKPDSIDYEVFRNATLIDVLDWNAIPNEFKQEIMKEHIVLQSGGLLSQ